jgi:hypothetical protein
LSLAILSAGLSLGNLNRKLRRRLVPLAGLALLIVAAGCLAGCTGGFPASQAATGTPAGTYIITVTGTSGTDMHSTTVTLIVQ